MAQSRFERGFYHLREETGFLGGRRACGGCGNSILVPKKYRTLRLVISDNCARGTCFQRILGQLRGLKILEVQRGIR